MVMQASTRDSFRMAPSTSSEDIVREFWRLMGTNDFKSVTSILDADFTLEWPQSNERIRGGERFVRVNEEYPSHGPWRFTLHCLVAGQHEVVTDVGVTDGVHQTRAISFFTIRRSRIVRIVEFWPKPYSAPRNRAHLVEPLS